MKVQIAIPTYQRADTFAAKTYKLLQSSPPKLMKSVTLFLQCQEDVEAYTSDFPELRIVEVRNVRGSWIVGFPETMYFMRKYYVNNFPGEPVLFLHDDVRYVYASSLEKAIRKLTLYELIKMMLPFAVKGASLVGIHPVGGYGKNRYLNKCKISGGLVFIYDPVHMEVNPEITKDMMCEAKSKCDYEFSLKAYDKGYKIRRLNSVFSSSRHNAFQNKAGGGIQDRKISTNLKDTKELRDRFPDYLKRWKTKKDGDTSPQFSRTLTTCEDK